MNRLNYEILEGIDAINDAELESGMKVLESVIRAYEKADMILENASESADLSSYDIFQESVLFQEADDATETKAEDKSEDDKANTGFRRINKKTGKKENILKSILLAIPRAIKMFINWLKKKFTKKKENDTNKAIDNVEKAVESGELAKHADIIMEELSTTPAEKAEVKKAASKKKSKQPAAQSGMDPIEAPKNATPEKKNDSSTKPAAPSMDDVSAPAAAPVPVHSTTVEKPAPQEQKSDWSADEDPMAVLKRFQNDPNGREKLAKYEAECLIKNGKIFISEAFGRNIVAVAAVAEFFEDINKLGQSLAEIQPDESRDSIVDKAYNAIVKQYNYSEIAVNKMKSGVIKERNNDRVSMMTIAQFKEMYTAVLEETKSIYNDGQKTAEMINKFILVFSDLSRSLDSSDVDNKQDLSNKIQECAEGLKDIRKTINLSMKIMTYFSSDFDYYAGAFVKIDEAFAKAVRKYRVFHDYMTGSSTRVGRQRNRSYHASKYALDESKEKGHNAVAAYERQMARYRQLESEDSANDRKRYNEETKNMSPEERRKWAEREYRE